ncbi:inovirus-type Gp2 protein [Lampropedia puyangensis]|uniref:inovirus-type Gp2 protein n=1 Tax=Lampropedia puyangensis TaxID=1330072 RepID=UPI0013052749|nr:inovirus-type Gp2 protein [Lampropedia puyangensis]
MKILNQSSSAYAYALRVLYLHLSNHHQRPNQGIYTDDHVAVQSILLCLQSVFNDPVFLSKLDNTRRSQQKSRDSLYQYATDLKHIYRKLMVVRVDFGYNQFVSKTVLPQRRIEDDWERQLQYVQKNFADSFVGYAVKFEHGKDKGLHAHSVFFFDGNVVCNDAKIGRILGEYWEHLVTDDLGLHFNCNTSDHKASLLVCGLGTFTGREQAFRDGMWIIADYLSKPDAMVRLLLPERTKIFRRGYLNYWQQLKLTNRLAMPCTASVEFTTLS